MYRFPRRQFLGTLAAAPVVTAAVSAADTGLASKTQRTKFAVNIEMWWRKLPFVERLKQAADFGFPAVEFWPWEGKDLAAIADICKQRKIEVAQFTAWGFKPGLNDPKNHELFLKKIEDGCCVAKQLNCRKMTVVGGDDVPGMTQAQMHQHIIDGLKKAAPIAEKNEIMLILEPMNIRVDHKGHCLYGSEAAVKICRAVGSKFVKINWDLYHMQISEGDLCGRLKDGLDQLGYVQLADHPGRNEPGTGEVNYSRVLRQLAELGYQDYVGLELRPKTDEMTAAYAVHKADQWVR
jgi:hydroxypyruvate isomerase